MTCKPLSSRHFWNAWHVSLPYSAFCVRPSHGLGDTQREAQELILGPCLGVKARFLSFNRTQSRTVTGLLTGHNTLRRHLYLMGLSDSSLCRCGAEDESSIHILCECEALVSLRHVYLGSFFFEPEDIKPLNAELNPICCLLALLGAQHFFHVSRIRVKSLTLRLLMSYIWSTYSWLF
jgi:hypothetical protein